MNRNWLKNYPQGVPSEIDPGQYSSLVHLLEEAFTRYRDRAAYIGFAKPMLPCGSDISNLVSVIWASL